MAPRTGLAERGVDFLHFSELIAANAAAGDSRRLQVNIPLERAGREP